MFNDPAKRETIYDPITGALPASALGIENKYERSVRRQIGRCIASKTPSAYFVELAARHDAEAGGMRYGNKGAQTREANRCRTVAAALREAGL